MLTLMLSEVNEFHSLTYSFNNGGFKRLALTHYSHHKAVMVFVVGVVEELYTLLAAKTFHNLLYLRKVASLAEIGHALYYLVHMIRFVNTLVFSDDITQEILVGYEGLGDHEAVIGLRVVPFPHGGHRILVAGP